jgi:predicted Ser/Thr protein kinase
MNPTQSNSGLVAARPQRARRSAKSHANDPTNLDETLDSWSMCLMELGIASDSLLWQSEFDPHRRVYAYEDQIYKIQLSNHDAVVAPRARDLAGELELLERCKGIPGTPLPIYHHRSEAYEVLVSRRAVGETLDKLQVGWLRLLGILVSLARILIALARRGVSQNDVRAENVLVGTDSVTLLDFDQATLTSTTAALLRSFSGLEVGEGAVHAGLFSIVKTEVKKRTSPRTVRLLKRLLGRGDEIDGHRLPTLAEDARAASKSLLLAWKIAQESAASSPGCRLAYYSFHHGRLHFPGERPWLERWKMLEAAADCSGKRVLELGCNMALLSCFLLKEGRAQATLAVDSDAQILEAAALTASALSVSPAFARVDFDDPADWESRLAGFGADVVFALNVLNWVGDKARFMSFLARFDEVVFEGHESRSVAEARFRAAGFSRIELLGQSERGRPLLRCRKAPA